jgi:putative aminopeptidase FrvX
MTQSPTKEEPQSPGIARAQIELLEKLTNACAVSGDEGEVRAIIREQIEEQVDEFNVDALGNILAVRSGQGANRLRVMLAAHMDEVGFMLTHEEDKDEGIYRFETVGGLDYRQLVGKAVWVGREHIPAVIGAKPVHLTNASERSRTISIDQLRIDVGPGNGGKVKVGDRAAFATPFAQTGPSLSAKALDDRLGVATLIELVKHAPPNIDLLAAFTVQEEVGLRGARVAAYAFDPDLAVVLDCTPAYDLPSWEAGESDAYENTRYNTRLGAGPAIYLADRATLSDPRLIRHFKDTAQADGIPYQLRQPGGGGTDAGVIHRQRSGVPSVSISVPGRYAHTAAMIARLSDWENSLKLVHSALKRLTPEIFSQDH